MPVGVDLAARCHIGVVHSDAQDVDGNTRDLHVLFSPELYKRHVAHRLPAEAIDGVSSALGADFRMVARIPHHTVGQRAGMLAVFQQHVSVYNRIMDTIGQLVEPPTTGRKIVHDIFFPRLHGVGIKNSIHEFGAAC